MPLPATVSPARSGKPSSRLETKKRDFPKSNVGKLNSVKPGNCSKGTWRWMGGMLCREGGRLSYIEGEFAWSLGGKSNWQEDARFRPQKVQSLP
jgi:hypothetical protein